MLTYDISNLLLRNISKINSLRMIRLYGDDVLMYWPIFNITYAKCYNIILHRPDTVQRFDTLSKNTEIQNWILTCCQDTEIIKLYGYESMTLILNRIHRSIRN